MEKLEPLEELTVVVYTLTVASSDEVPFLTFNFGDGALVTVSNQDGGNETRHQYEQEGLYTIEVTLAGDEPQSETVDVSLP